MQRLRLREREVCNILKTLLKFCVHKKRRKVQVQIVTKATPQCKRLPPFVYIGIYKLQPTLPVVYLGS
jgi:hypothetical protein